MKKLILEYEDDKDFEMIENAFKVIKKGGSKLQSKEDMCKLLIEKEIGLANILFYLSSTSASPTSTTQKEFNKDFTAQSVSPKVCPKCAGWKKVPDTSPSKTGFMTCPNCKGTGKPS